MLRNYNTNTFIGAFVNFKTAKIVKYPESQDVNRYCWELNINSASEQLLKETNKSDRCHFTNEETCTGFRNSQSKTNESLK